MFIEMRWHSDPLESMRPRRQNLWQKLVEALLESIEIRGYPETTIQHIADLAGVNRTQFYFLFEDKEQCFLAAQSVVLAEAETRLRELDYGQVDWPEPLRIGIETLTAFFDEEPAMARLLLLESAIAGPAAMAQHQEALAKLVPYLARNREMAADRSLPGAIEEMALGSVIALLTRELQASEAPSFSRLNPNLYFALLMPFAGPVKAGELVEASYPAATAPR